MAVAVPSVTAGSPLGEANPAAPVGWLNISAVPDYGYQPATLEQVPVGASIQVKFTDDDVLQHSFTISSRQGFVIPTSYTPQQLTHFFAEYPPLISLLVNYSGAQSFGTFPSPATPGWYEFVCNVSGHFENGMYGFIAFGENLPTNLTPPSRTGVGGSGVNPVDVVVIVVVIGLIALGLVLWSRERTRRLRASSRPPRTPSSPPPPPRV